MTKAPSRSDSWIDLSNEIGSGGFMQSEGPGAGYQEHSGGFYIPQEGAGGFTTPPTTSPGGFTTPPTTTPIPFGSDQDYMRMLKEAQKETSCRSSARVSPLTSARVSQRASPCYSPKSTPPNSPRTELGDLSAEFGDVFINKIQADTMTDFMWDWSSSPCQPREWKSGNQATSRTEPPPSRSSSPISTLYTFLFSNFVSLLLGAGLGAWIYKRSTLRVQI